MIEIASFISGAAAGVIGTVIGFPLDTVKTRLQVRGEGNAFAAIRAIAKNEGAKGFFRGLPENVYMKYFDTRRRDDNDRKATNQPSFLGYFICGAMLGPFSSMISTPFEFVKVQLQMDNLTGKNYNGGADLLKKLHHNQKLHKIYRGYMNNLLLESLFLGTYFGIYECCKTPFGVAISGALAGCGGWIVAMPLDTIKQRQLSVSVNETMPSISAVWKMLDLKSIRAAAGTALFRSLIVSSSRFYVFETSFIYLKRRLNPIDEDDEGIMTLK